MKTEQQRIAIAEACGRDMRERPKTGWHDFGCDCQQCHKHPDYLNDLNAIHEAEKVLTTTEQQNSYYANIAEITWGCEETSDRQVVFNQLTATAAQRAEAFLKTLNLWTE